MEQPNYRPVVPDGVSGLDRGRQSYSLGDSDDAVWHGGIVAGYTVDSCFGGQGPLVPSLLICCKNG